MKLYIIIYMASLSLITYSIAAESNDSVSAISGIGVLSCKAYLNQTDDKNDSKKIISDLAFAWAQGFMSGMNVSTMTLTKNKSMNVNLNAMSDDEKELFIRVYCRKHSDARVYEAIMELYNELSSVEMGK